MIFSDSLSSLQALQGVGVDNPFLMHIHNQYRILTEEHCKIVILCSGNEAADKAAKTALNLPVTLMPMHFADFKPKINAYIDLLWQQRWDGLVHNKLRLQPEIEPPKLLGCTTRREEVVLSRLRIGHTNLTHVYLIRREEQPQCTACQCPLTVQHILIECADFLETREKYFTVQDMKELFEKVSLEDIFGYLKEIGLFRKI